MGGFDFILFAKICFKNCFEDELGEGKNLFSIFSMKRDSYLTDIR